MTSVHIATIPTSNTKLMALVMSFLTVRARAPKQAKSLLSPSSVGRQWGPK